MSIGPGWQADQRMRAVAAELDHQDFAPADAPTGEDHEEHAAGEVCARCHAVIGAREDVRKNARGEWVHQDCRPGE